MDQPEDLMRAFDTIDQRVSAAGKRHEENALRDKEMDRLKGELRGRS